MDKRKYQKINFMNMACGFAKFTQQKIFDVLPTVHLSIFISVINQLDAQNLRTRRPPIGMMISEAV